MPRIAILVSNPCTADARVIKVAKTAAEAGHEVHVFATMGNNAAAYEVADTIVYHRLTWRPRDFIPGNQSPAWMAKVSKRLYGACFSFLLPYRKYSLFRRVFAEQVAAVKPDVIYANDLICLPAGHHAATLSNARLIYDAHELEVHRNPPLPFLQKRYVAHIEKKYARRADVVITVGELVAAELGAHIRRDDIDVIYNSPALSPCARSIREDLRLAQDTPLIVYVGKVTVGRGVGDLIASLPQMPGISFAAVGPCDSKTFEVLTAQAHRLGISHRVRLLPPVPSDQVVSYIRGADLGVISVEPVTLSYRYCMPNKLFELSFANVPVFSNNLDDIARFLGEFGNGRIFNFEDKYAFPHAMFEMIRHKDRYLMGEDARMRLHAKYSLQTQQNKLLAILGRLAVQPMAA
jgi:glycosyltransferase involved in cell wall biosynthesis